MWIVDLLIPFLLGLLVVTVTFYVIRTFGRRQAVKDARWRRRVRHLRDGSFAVIVERVAFHGSVCSSLESRLVGRVAADSSADQYQKYVDLLEEANVLVDQLNER